MSHGGPDRTEQATPRRRDEARKRGEGIGRSPELATALTLATALLAMPTLVPMVYERMRVLVSTVILDVGSGDLGTALALERLGGAIVDLLACVLPLALLVGFAGIVASLAAGGLVFTFHTLQLDLGRMNPAKGLVRMVSKQTLTRLGISLAKLALLAGIAWSIFGERLPPILRLSGADIEGISGVAGNAIFGMGIVLLMAFGLVALTDYVLQQRRAQGQLKMTKDEVKREVRESEGDPYVKAASRDWGDELLREGRTLEETRKSDVVVRNPTHLAVALRYDPHTMPAPRLVAKGRRLLAQRMCEVAAAAGVPVIEDRPLAWGLIDQPIGAEVPRALYDAAARIIALVYDMRFGRRRWARTRGGRAA